MKIGVTSLGKATTYGIAVILFILGFLVSFLSIVLNVVFLGYIGFGVLLFSLILVFVNMFSAHTSRAYTIQRIARLRYRGYTLLADDAERRLDKDPEGSYREVTSSKLHRVVVDPIADEEILIHGKSNTTFRAALLKFWGFSRIDRESRWSIVDERGNDITDTSLSSFAGIATIKTEEETQSVQKDSREETYSSIVYDVEYYD